MQGTRRLFFALWLDERSQQYLQQSASALLAPRPGRAVLPADWHVTLCFLGAVPSALLAPLLAQSAQVRVAAFVLPLTQVGYWRAARVIAATAAQVPEPALQLAAQLRTTARSLGLDPDDKPLRPHVTLARGVSAAQWQRACTALTDERLLLKWPLAVSEFQLAESLPAPASHNGWPEGSARYAPLARWPLRG